MSVLDDLLGRAAKLPARQTWVLSCSFPRGDAMIFDAPDEKVVAIHPETWGSWRHTVSSACSREGVWAVYFQPSPMLLDPVDDDDEALAQVRRDERIRVFGVIAAVMLAAFELRRAFDPEGANERP